MCAGVLVDIEYRQKLQNLLGFQDITIYGSKTPGAVGLLLGDPCHGLKDKLIPGFVRDWHPIANPISHPSGLYLYKGLYTKDYPT